MHTLPWRSKILSMRRKPPLQITIFILLFVFTLAGKSLEGTGYFLRQDLSVTTSANAATAKENLIRQNSPVMLMNKEAQATRQVSGEVVAKNGNTVKVEDGDSIVNVVLPSNAYVMKNGFEAERSELAKDDYVFASVNNDNTAVSISSFPKYAVDAIMLLVIVSILITGYFLAIFTFRLLRSMFSAGHDLHGRIAA